MTYRTLYRKYRSNSLDELVGQTHIIKTLTNAIQYDRLSHGYIFPDLVVLEKHQLRNFGQNGE